METAEDVLGYKREQPRSPWLSIDVLELSDKREDLRKTKGNYKANRKEYDKITPVIEQIAKGCKEI